MEPYSNITNSSDYESFLVHHKLLNEVCKNGCEIDGDVALARNVLEFILIPAVGSIGIIGNMISIIVLCNSAKKTTFQHVSYVINLLEYNFFT